MTKPNSDKTDMDLITETLNGVNSSFTTLVNRYKDSLYWVVYRVVGNAVDAEDIAAEVFIKAYESLSSYSPKYAFSTWLHTIGQNKAIDFVRMRNKQPTSANNLVSVEDDFTTPIICTDLTAEDKMISSDIKHIVGNEIETLKPFHKTLIHMKYFQDLSYEEIAERLNKPIGTIKTGLFRARRTLYNLMKDNKNLK